MSLAAVKRNAGWVAAGVILALLVVWALWQRQPWVGPGGTRRAWLGPGGTQQLLGPGGTRQLLGAEGFADGGNTASDEAPQFYMIKADWCPHCKNTKPQWKLLQEMPTIKTSDGRPVTIAEPIDGADADALGLEYKGFPTFVLRKDGVTQRCPTERNPQAWAAWLQQQ